MAPSSDSAGEARRLLADTRQLTSHVRREQRATSAALLVLGVVVLSAIPFYEYGQHVVVHCQATGGERICTRYPTLALWYWPVALTVGYCVIAVIYRHRARRRGVDTRVLPYVLGGIGLAAVSTLVTVWALRHPTSWSQLGGPLMDAGSADQARLSRLLGSLGMIGLGLLLLAWLERSTALAAFTVGYLVSVVVTTPVGVHPGRLYVPGILIPGLVLLSGSLGFAYLEHRAPTSP
jgi:hypothetical protein